VDHTIFSQRLRDADRLLPGRQWYLLVEDARVAGVTADCVQLMLLKVTQAMAGRCVVRHIVENRTKEKLCMLVAHWVASVADAPFKCKVDVIDVHGKHMHGNAVYDAKLGSASAWKATVFAMPGFSEMAVEPLVQRFPTLRALIQHVREVGMQRAVVELAGVLFAWVVSHFLCLCDTLLSSFRRAEVRQHRTAATRTCPRPPAADGIYQRRLRPNVWPSY
jgi:Holliday junction resolvase-like predicted endonuclease